MGCNQSRDMQEAPGPVTTKEKKQTGSVEPGKQNMDVNSNEQKTNGHMEIPGKENAEKFTQLLMTQLHSLSAGQAPPMAPKKLVEGDDRMLLVPALFKCEETLAELKETPLPADSSLLVTYLKAGTHWAWEIMKMLKRSNTEYDVMPKESAHLEFLPPSSIKDVNNQHTPVFVTHFPMWCLPKSCYSHLKTVFVYRNPKDSCVSSYYHYLNMAAANPQFPEIPFEAFFEMYMGPSEANIMGNWFDHLADFWDNHRENPNILCVMYEDMKKDPLKAVTRINEHLGTGASDNLICDIVKATSFNSMKEGKSHSEKFLEPVFKGTMYRKGEVGDWKNHMNDDMNKRMDERIQQWQSERTTPVPLVYEL